MAIVLPIGRKSAGVVDLGAEAMDNLSFIRTAMENAGSFTAVPGVGGVLMGGTALLAALSAHFSRSPVEWLEIWIAEALLALGIAVWFSSRKAMRIGAPVLSRPFRRFVLAMTPSVFVGAILTAVLYRMSGTGLLPAVWLLLYGAGVSSGGAFFGSDRSTHGWLVFVAWCCCGHDLSGLGRSVDGAGIWRSSHHLWLYYREEIRWLEQEARRRRRSK